MGKSYLFSLCFVMFAYCINAQSYHTAASAGYYFSSADANPESSDIAMTYLRISAPLKLRNGNYLLINPDLHMQSLKFDAMDTRRVRKTGLSFNYLHIKDKRTTIGILNFSNQFEKNQFALRSAQIGAGILFSKKKSDKLKLKYGIYANKEFFGVLIVPLLGLDYKMNPKMRVFGILPQFFKAEYKSNKTFRTGFLFEAPLYTYLLNNKGYQYIDQRLISLGLYQSFYLTKNLVLELAVKQPVSVKEKLFMSNQTNDLNILGIGIGGERAKNDLPVKEFKHGFIIDFSLQYRIEVD